MGGGVGVRRTRYRGSRAPLHGHTLSSPTAARRSMIPTLTPAASRPPAGGTHVATGGRDADDTPFSLQAAVYPSRSASRREIASGTARSKYAASKFTLVSVENMERRRKRSSSLSTTPTPRAREAAVLSPLSAWTRASWRWATSGVLPQTPMVEHPCKSGNMVNIQISNPPLRPAHCRDTESAAPSRPRSARTADRTLLQGDDEKLC